MIIIADSGSSKTSWYISGTEGNPIRLKTNGINPFFRSSEDIVRELQNKFSEEIKNTISEMYFYGAGITNEEKRQIVHTAFSTLFPKTNVEISSDLLAAARATLKHEKGIACILGTGSNSCFYNGRAIEKNIPPLGFILGDEGSGSYIGRRLVADFLRGIMPKDLSLKFAEKYPFTYSEYLESTYKQEKPNKFLAQFVQFAGQNIGNAYCSELVEKAFQEFAERNLLQYNLPSNYKISFVGSVAYYFQQQLKNVLKRNNLNLSLVLKDPIEGLIHYHEKK